jgi:hypothetical protein
LRPLSDARDCEIDQSSAEGVASELSDRFTRSTPPIDRARSRAQSRQKSRKRLGLSSVYRTVCWIRRWPSQPWTVLVSWPALASA